MRTNFFNYLVVTMLFLSLTAQAQETHFGIKAGVNFSNISSDAPGYSADMRVGVHIGAGVMLGLSDNFSITGDVIYNMKGAKQSIEETHTSGSATITNKSKETLTASYIEIPIMARYSLESGLYFNGGLYFGFLAGFKDDSEETSSTTINGTTTVESSSSSSTDHTGWNTTDTGLKLGLGYKMDSGLDLAVNYSLGLSNIINISGNPYKAHHNVIGLTVGYWFGGK